MNSIILKFFGLSILIAISLGISFPYVALTIMPLGFLFLFILMILSGLTIEWDYIWKIIKKPGCLIIGNLFIFVIFPVIQLLIAKQFLSNTQFLYGAVFSSLMPVAIVAPFFTGIVKGNKELSFLLLITSMLISPFITPFLLKLYVGPMLPISTWLIFKGMVILIPLPLLISFLISKFFIKTKKFLNQHMAILNMLCLSILIFVLFGVSISRLNINYVTFYDLFILLLLGFFQDFGVFFISGILFSKLYLRKKINSLRISLSMKNIAVAAGILLFYDPKAALAPAICFIAHAFLFNFIPIFRNRLK